MVYYNFSIIDAVYYLFSKFNNTSGLEINFTVFVYNLISKSKEHTQLKVDYKLTVNFKCSIKNLDNLENRWIYFQIPIPL